MPENSNHLCDVLSLASPRFLLFPDDPPSILRDTSAQMVARSPQLLSLCSKLAGCASVTLLCVGGQGRVGASMSALMVIIMEYNLSPWGIGG